MTMAEIKKVRRCLFGRPGAADSDDSAFQKLCKTQDEIVSERFRDRWNYDVKTDTALPGDREWTSVPADSVPSVYLKGYTHRCRQRTAMTCMDTVQNSCYFDNSSNDSSSQDSVRDCENVDVLIGRVHSPQDETTPPNNGHKRTKQSTEQRGTKRTTQRILLDCDRWSVRKKRRSLTPETKSENSAKRQRLDLW